MRASDFALPRRTLSPCSAPASLEVRAQFPWNVSVPVVLSVQPVRVPVPVAFRVFASALSVIDAEVIVSVSEQFSAVTGMAGQATLPLQEAEFPDPVASMVGPVPAPISGQTSLAVTVLPFTASVSCPRVSCTD